MIYEPKYYSIEALLIEAGYSPKGVVMGWARPFDKKKKGRYHAIINRGVIDLHWDRQSKGRHLASKFGELARNEIDRLRSLDEKGRHFYEHEDERTHVQDDEALDLLP